MNAQAPSNAARKERIVDDVAGRIGDLFERCPDLSGFHVEHDGELRDAGGAVLEGGLLVGEVTVASLISASALVARDEIVATLVELLDEYPDVHELLRDRTFARTLH